MQLKGFRAFQVLIFQWVCLWFWFQTCVCKPNVWFSFGVVTDRAWRNQTNSIKKI